MDGFFSITGTGLFSRIARTGSLLRRKLRGSSLLSGDSVKGNEPDSKEYSTTPME